MINKTFKEQPSDQPKYFYKRQLDASTNCISCGYKFTEDDQYFQEMGPSYTELISTCPKCGEEYYD